MGGTPIPTFFNSYYTGYYPISDKSDTSGTELLSYQGSYPKEQIYIP